MRAAWAASGKKSPASARWSSWPSIQAARLPCSASTLAKREMSNRVGTVRDASARIVPPCRVSRSAPPLDETIFAAALAVQRANLPVLADPVVMARWLCGITSPALTKSKLSSHPLFGAFAQQSFPKLRERLVMLSSHRGTPQHDLIPFRVFQNREHAP